MPENECNGLTTAKYFVAQDAAVQNPPREEEGRPSAGEAKRPPRVLMAAILFSIVFSLAAGLGLCYQIYLPVLLKKTSTLLSDVAKPLKGVREQSPQTALQKMLLKNHADVMAEIQQRNKANPVSPHLEKLTREGWPQQNWNVGNGFQPVPFGAKK